MKSGRLFGAPGLRGSGPVSTCWPVSLVLLRVLGGRLGLTFISTLLDTVEFDDAAEFEGVFGFAGQVSRVMWQSSQTGCSPQAT